MVHRFCAICGKSLGDSSPHFGMCLECFIEETNLFEIPKKFSFRTCLDCGKYSVKEEWFDPTEKDIHVIVQEAVHRFLLRNIAKNTPLQFSTTFNEESFEFSSKDLLKALVLIVQGRLKGNEKIESQQQLIVNINYEFCKNCTNLRGGTYFLSIIQLRVRNEKQFDKLKEIIDFIYQQVEKLFRKDNKQYITKSVDEKNGVDLYLSTNELMNQIIKILRNNYHFILKRTKKLVGRDSQKGKNIYRQKALIKILPVQRNDHIHIDGREYSIESISKNKVILRSKNGEKILKEFSFFFNKNINLSD
ncbi:MAG: NMD3-related protein [Promethearchaeota archaeon]